MPKKKPETISSLKKEAWSWFSKYIRLRDCLKTTGTKEWGVCITCGKTVPFSGGAYNSLQAGHFVDGRRKEYLFDERIVNGQCGVCNIAKGGNKDSYTLVMIKKYGHKYVEEVLQMKKSSLASTEVWTKDELRAIRDEYKELFESAYKNN